MCFWAIYELAFLYLCALSNLFNGLWNDLCNLSSPVSTLLMTMQRFMCYKWIVSFKAFWRQSWNLSFSFIYGCTCLYLFALSNIFNCSWTNICNRSLPVFCMIIDMWRFMYWKWMSNFCAYSRRNLYLYFWAIYVLAFLYLRALSNLFNGLWNDPCNLTSPVSTMLMTMRRFMCCKWIVSFKAF